MLLIQGWGSKIADEVRALIRGKDVAFRLGDALRPLDGDRYLFTAGVLPGKQVVDLSQKDIEDTLNVNFIHVIQACEIILGGNPRARICVIGSESGKSGSFDKLYAGSKAAIANYVETRRVGPSQQLVGIAPNIIEDCGMTVRRVDREVLNRRRLSHPKARYLMAAEVARLAVFLLYEDSGYICNTMIRMNGGEHAR